MKSLWNCAVDCTNRSSRRVNGCVPCCVDITRITECRPTLRRSTCSGRRSRIAGSSRSGDAASAAASTGHGWIVSPNSGSHEPALSTLGRSSALLSDPEIRAQCGSPARWDLCGGRLESSTTKSRPYRDRKTRKSAFIPGAPPPCPYQCSGPVSPETAKPKPYHLPLVWKCVACSFRAGGNSFPLSSAAANFSMSRAVE